MLPGNLYSLVLCVCTVPCKTVNDFMVYSTASNMKSSRKVQLSQYVNKPFVLSKQRCIQFSHRRAATTPLVDCLVDDILQQTRPSTQQSGAASDQQRRV